MRALCELWELCTVVSAANAILMYVSELMLEQVMKLLNVPGSFYFNAPLLDLLSFNGNHKFLTTLVFSSHGISVFFYTFLFHFILLFRT